MGLKPDLNPIENMWSEVDMTMQVTCSVLSVRNSSELWILVSDTWDEVPFSQHYILSLIKSMTQVTAQALMLACKPGNHGNELCGYLHLPVSQMC
jgi:hypothetical protein